MCLWCVGFHAGVGVAILLYNIGVVLSLANAMLPVLGSGRRSQELIDSD